MNMHTIYQWYYKIYSLFLIIGGAIAFWKVSSIASLFGGCGSGIVMLLLYSKIYGPKIQPNAFVGVTSLLVTIASFFGYKAFTDGGIRPILISVGGVLLLLMLMRYFFKKIKEIA